MSELTLKYRYGDRVTIRVDSRLPMHAVVAECFPSQKKPPFDQPMYRVELTNGESALFAESELEPREESGNDALFFQKIILDDERSLDIAVYRRDPFIISMSAAGTEKYSDRMIEAEMSRYRAAALIDALMGAVNCVDEQKKAGKHERSQ